MATIEKIDIVGYNGKEMENLEVGGCDFSSEEFKEFLAQVDTKEHRDYLKKFWNGTDENIDKDYRAEWKTFVMLRNFVNANEEINKNSICVYNFLFRKRTNFIIHSNEWKKLEKMVREYENKKYEARKMKRQMKLEGEKDALAILKKAFDDAMTKGYKNVERAIASGNGLVDEKFKKCIKKVVDSGYNLYDAKWGKKRMCYYFTKSENGATNMNENAIEEIYNHVSMLRGWAIYGL